MTFRLKQVAVPALSPSRFAEVLDEAAYASLQGLIERAVPALHGRVIWNVNSTARGGGVVELLRSLLGYARGVGVDARWMVIRGDEDFFRVTKRLHNRLHGYDGDGGTLSDKEQAVYEATLAPNGERLAELVQSRDIVLLHDPQTAGLVDAVKATGAHVIWRAHVGRDHPNHIAREAWNFLRSYVLGADAFVFSRDAFVWTGLPREKVSIIPPSIDAFSPKNEPLSVDQVLGILHAAGFITDGGGDPTFVRSDGSPGRVDRTAEIVADGPPLGPDDPVVLQLSRWDRLKDPLGLMRAFELHVASACDAHLILAGPAVDAVSDDPEGLEVFHEVREARRALSDEIRRRVRLAMVPMYDTDENAAIVNALQRHASVVVQKSLAEGFGLTVAEAMWKGRPVVASRVGGIQDQIVDGESGILLANPRDLEAAGEAIVGLVQDPEAAHRMGEAAQRRARDDFLGPRHLGQYFELFHELIAAETVGAAT